MSYAKTFLVGASFALAIGTASAQTAVVGTNEETHEGVVSFAQGNVPQAHQIFEQQYQQDPANPYFQFNLADSARALGQTQRAHDLYRQVTATGRGVHPRVLLEPHGPNTTLADAACQHLAQDGVAASDCGT
jgi:thioredoxin-like negative regulator of GroEL